MSMPVIGAQLFTLRDFTNTMEDVRNTLKKVAAIGYRAVQVSGFGPVDMEEVARICDGEGLAVVATHVGWDRFLQDLDALIEEHKTLGCEHPAIGGLPGEYRSKDGVRRFIDELTPIAARLDEEGMDFSYHNHHHELIKYDGRTWLGMLYEQAPPEVLKAEIDTYWIQAGGGDPALWINRCAGREPLVHFKDMGMGTDGEPRMTEVGEGNLNWDAIIQACCDGGVEQALVEQDHCYGRDPFEALAISFRNLKAMGLRTEPESGTSRTR